MGIIPKNIIFLMSSSTQSITSNSSITPNSTSQGFIFNNNNSIYSLSDNNNDNNSDKNESIFKDFNSINDKWKQVIAIKYPLLQRNQKNSKKHKLINDVELINPAELSHEESSSFRNKDLFVFCVAFLGYFGSPNEAKGFYVNMLLDNNNKILYNPDHYNHIFINLLSKVNEITESDDIFPDNYD